MASATVSSAKPHESKQPLSEGELRKMHAYWRAANYLSVGQIYLYANPLLQEPLKREHVKPRLLGHWGTTPGLNFIYVHFNRLIKKYDLNVIYVAGPGHGGGRDQTALQAILIPGRNSKPRGARNAGLDS